MVPWYSRMGQTLWTVYIHVHVHVTSTVMLVHVSTFLISYVCGIDIAHMHIIMHSVTAVFHGMFLEITILYEQLDHIPSSSILI